MTSPSESAWNAASHRIKGLFDDMEFAEVMSRGNAFNTGMDAQAHVALKCVEIVQEEAKHNNLDTTAALSLMYYITCMSEEMFRRYVETRNSRWGWRSSPEVMSLSGFSGIEND